MLPPAVYLQEVPEPKLRGGTNAYLLEWAMELREALRLANSDKKALREWAASGKLGIEPASQWELN